MLCLIGFELYSRWVPLIDAMFLLVNSFKMTGMLLNVVHDQVQKS